MRSIIRPAAVVVAASLAVAACAPAQTQPKAEVSSVNKSRVTAAGEFRGENNHVVTGKALVSHVDGQWVVTLDEAFSLDGAPDPKVALGNGGYVEGTILGKLKSLDGKQSYALPDNLDIGDYVQVYIWCEKFNVSLGVADLTLTCRSGGGAPAGEAARRPRYGHFAMGGSDISTASGLWPVCRPN
ncbi:MAG: DM13 domain-containing protein [Pseudomonadota bacterium]